MHPETEPLRLAETLLRQCLADFSPIFACHGPLSRASRKKEATQQDRKVDDYEGCLDVDFLSLCHDIVARLNVLVLLSQAVFTRLQQAVPRLRRVFLVAVYRVLSLALCNGQRAVRCAGIRCLRHYVRSNSDVDLLLSNRLDLFITRCFDLSYESGMSATESFEFRGRNVAAANTSPPQPAQQAALHARLPTLFGKRLMRPEFRRRIQPGSRLRSTSEDRTDVTRFAPSTITKTSLQNRVGTAYTGIISPSSERLQVLKLAYQLLRLAPSIFPFSLVQALVSSCLSPLWVATAGSTVDRIMSTGNTLAAANINEWAGAPAHPPLAGAHPPLPVATTASTYEVFADDPHIRACLLILVEFVLSHCSHGPMTTFITAEKASYSHRSSLHLQTMLALRNCVKCVLHAFVCDPISRENVKHPALLLRTLLMVLISLADGPYGRRLIEPAVFQKFLVPFTASFPFASVPRSVFDTYPDIITVSTGAVILLLRSWPGIFHFLSVEGQQCLCTVTHSLTMGSSKLRLRILCLLYSLLPGLPFPCLSTVAVGTMMQQSRQRRQCQQQYQLDVSRLVQALHPALSNATPEPFPNLDGDFVVDEGFRLFDRPRHRLCASFGGGGGGTCLREAHTSLLLCLLTNAGLLEGLVSAAEDANPLVSAASTQLLGFLAYKSNALFPQEHPCSQRLCSLILFNPTSPSSHLTVDQISRVHAVLEDFDKYTSTLDICAPLHSPFLEQLASQGRTNNKTNGLFSRVNPSVTVPSVNTPKDSVHVTSGMSSARTPLRRRNQPSTSATAATTVLQPSDDLLENVFVQSRVIIQSTPPYPRSSKTSSRRTTFSVSQKPYSWNWEVLATWARSVFAINKPLSWKAPLRQSFLRRLFDFLTPDILLLSLPIHTITDTASSLSYLLPGHKEGSGTLLSPFYASLLRHKRAKNPTNDAVCMPNLAWTSQSWTEAWAAGVLLGGLLPHLYLYPADSLPGQLLRRFLQSIHQCLLATLAYEGQIGVHAGGNSDTPISYLHLLFQPAHLKNFCSPLLLFALGQLSSCEAGYELLSSMGLTETVFQVLERPAAPNIPRPIEVQTSLNRQTLLLSKILLASSSFTSKEGFGQRLLFTVFRYGTQSVRLFAVKFIRLLLRMGLPVDPNICISLLLRSLFDSSIFVMEEAIDVLEEACEMGGPNLKVISDYCNGSGDPAVLMTVAKNLGDHLASDAAGDVVKCRHLDLPLLLLTPEAGLAGHRILASLLSMPSVFNRLLHFPPSAPPVPSASNLVHWMLSAWRQFYNERYANDLQHAFSSLFQLRHSDEKAPMASEAPLPSCPGCGLQVKSLLLSTAAGMAKKSCLRRTNGCLSDVADSFEVDLDLLIRRSNAASTHRSLLAYIGDETEKAKTPMVEVSILGVDPANTHLFTESGGSVVPVHLYSCLAMHDGGFDLLCNRGGLEEFVNILSTYIDFCLATRPGGLSSVPAISTVQAAIWALSHVLVTQRGSTWPRATAVVGHLTRICSLAESMSVRGAAWLGLCFIASSRCGADLISRFGSPPDPESPQPIPIWYVSRTGRFHQPSPPLPRLTLCLTPKLGPDNLSSHANTDGLSTLKSAFANLLSRKISAPTLVNKERNVAFHANSEQTEELLQRGYISPMCPDSHPPTNAPPQCQQALLLNVASSLPRPTSHQCPSGSATQSVLRPALNIFKALSIKPRTFRGCGQKSSLTSSSQALEEQQALDIGKEGVLFTRMTSNTSTDDSNDGFLISANVTTPHSMRRVVSGGRLERPQQRAWTLTIPTRFSSQSYGGQAQKERTRSSTAPPYSGFTESGGDSCPLLNSASPTAVVALYSCPVGCASQSCRLSGRSHLRDVGIERVNAWRVNLLGAVEDSLNTVLLARSESTLADLLTEASTDIGASYMNACVFTEVSCFLTSYTFTRPARTMIQSFLSSFPLPEAEDGGMCVVLVCVTDARTAVFGAVEHEEEAEKEAVEEEEEEEEVVVRRDNQI
nr:unnamed protein product [Spirometra erinaceieuropaei]